MRMTRFWNNSQQVSSKSKDWKAIKRFRKPKEQSRMDNPETLATWANNLRLVGSK
jgi:hypothetical protein